MGRLRRSDFPNRLTREFFLSQHEADCALAGDQPPAPQKFS